MAETKSNSELMVENDFSTHQQTHIYSNYPFSHVTFCIFFSFPALHEGGAGDDSLYFHLYHWETI